MFFYPVGAIKFTFVKYKLVSVDRPLRGFSCRIENIFWQQYFFSESFDIAHSSQNRWYWYSIIGGAFKLQGWHIPAIFSGAFGQEYASTT